MNEYGLLDVPSSPRKMASTKSTADKLELTKKVSENLSQQRTSQHTQIASPRGRKLLRRQMQRMFQLKQQLLAVRQRRAVIPKVPDPEILNYFTDLKLIKQREHLKRRLKEKIDEKKRELSKFKDLYSKSQQEYEQKNQVFREKSALQRVLASKMQGQLTKTKERFRQVEFNRVILDGVRKVLYYRLAEIMFNETTRSIFTMVRNTYGTQAKLQEDNIGNCLGYLGLFLTLVGNICGARLWINFVFRGSRSSIRSTDGSAILLHPRDSRLSQAQRLLNQQLYQIIRDNLRLKIQNPNNFYLLCQELSKFILSAGY